MSPDALKNKNACLLQKHFPSFFFLNYRTCQSLSYVNDISKSSMSEGGITYSVLDVFASQPFFSKRNDKSSNSNSNDIYVLTMCLISC